MNANEKREFQLYAEKLASDIVAGKGDIRQLKEGLRIIASVKSDGLDASLFNDDDSLLLREETTLIAYWAESKERNAKQNALQTVFDNTLEQFLKGAGQTFYQGSEAEYHAWASNSAALNKDNFGRHLLLNSALVQAHVKAEVEKALKAQQSEPGPTKGQEFSR